MEQAYELAKKQDVPEQFSDFLTEMAEHNLWWRGAEGQRILPSLLKDMIQMVNGLVEFDADGF